MTSDSGEFDIALPDDIQAGDPVLIFVENWVVMEPYVGTRGEFFLPKSTNQPIEVVVSKKGATPLLDDGQITQIVAQAVSRLAQSGKASDIGDDFLYQTAKEIGFSIDKLKESIDHWARTVEDPYQKGLAALYEQRYVEAGKLIQQSIASSEDDLIEKYLVLTAAYNLQGDYPSAEMVITKAHTLRKQDPRILNLFAAVLNNQAKYSEAESMLKEAQAIEQKASGGVNPDFATTLGNLAYLYTAQGRYQDAEPLQRQALDIDVRAYGLENPEVAIDLTNLGSTYLYEERYKDAEPLLKRAIEIDTIIFGPASPATSRDVTNLAVLYKYQGRYGEAQKLFEQVVETDKRTSNPNMTSVATHLGNLGAVYLSLGRFKEAEKLLNRQLEIDRTALGAGHPGLATDLVSLGSFYNSRQSFSQAIPLLEEARKIDEASFGTENEALGEVLRSLALSYSGVGNYHDAKELAGRAQEIHRKNLGSVSSEYAFDLNTIADIDRRSGDFDNAELRYKQAESILQKGDPQSANVADIESNLGRLYYEAGKYDRAEASYRRALDIYAHVFDKDSLLLAVAEENLAIVLEKTGKTSESQQLNERARRVLTQPNN